MNKQIAESIEQRVKYKKRLSKNKKSVLYVLFYLLIALSTLLFADFSSAQTKLKTKIPELCYECHKQLKDSLSQNFVHFPFKQGRCEACHNVHASKQKDLMKDDLNSVCLGCHEGIRNLMSKDLVHGALKKGICTNCHSPHAGMIKYLLTKEEKSLCWNCHETLKEEFGKPHIHKPFKEGECSSCHNAHSSSEKNLLSSSSNKICQSCHQPRCNVANISIVSITKVLDCNTCHTGHASESKGLLGPYGHTAFLNKNCEQCHNPIKAGDKITVRVSGKELCFSCHAEERAKISDSDVHLKDSKGCALCHNYHASARKNLVLKDSAFCFTCHQNTQKRQISMIKSLKSIRCEPVKDSKCFECHTPVHSRNFLSLKEGEIKTCARCHEAQHKVAHPLGEGVLDPRNNKPITCITCHSMHSAKADFMLYFDRRRALCIQCHKR